VEQVGVGDPLSGEQSKGLGLTGVFVRQFDLAEPFVRSSWKGACLFCYTTTTLPSSSTASTTSTTTTASTGTILFRTSFADSDRAPSDLRQIHFFNGLFRFSPVWHFDKSEATGAPGLTIHDDVD